MHPPSQRIHGTWIVAVPGQEAGTLLIESASLSDGGVYTVAVSNGSCSALANPWKVVVKGVPNMIEQDIVKVCSNEALGAVLKQLQKKFIPLAITFRIHSFPKKSLQTQAMPAHHLKHW